MLQFHIVQNKAPNFVLGNAEYFISKKLAFFPLQTQICNTGGTSCRNLYLYIYIKYMFFPLHVIVYFTGKIVSKEN